MIFPLVKQISKTTADIPLRHLLFAFSVSAFFFKKLILSDVFALVP